MGLRPHSDYRVMEETCIIICHYYLPVPGMGKQPSFDMVAISQAPSLDSNPDYMLLMVTMEGPYSTVES